MQDKEIEQLLHQEIFLNYCFQRNEDDIRNWEEWLAQNPGQRQQFEDLRRMLLLMGVESRNRITKVHFEELQERIDQTQSDRVEKTFPFWKKWNVAAAAALVLIAGAWFFYDSSTTKMNPAQLADIGPGGNKATLILANGQKLNLTNAANGSIATQAGIRIRKTSDGQIIYEISKAGENVSSTQYNTIETPIGGQYQVNLSDGTKVWLNAGSSLRYPLKFAAHERKVELNGEGYFEVAPNKSSPFRVSNSRQMVEVLGTHFNVMSYADEKVIKTTLLEGAVQVNGGGNSARLNPGQQAQLANGKVKVVDDVDIEDVVAWKNGYFRFNESLESIMSKVSRWYGVQVIYETDIDPEQTFSGKISRSKNISVILKSIEFDSELHFKVDGKKVYVTK